MFLKSLKFKLDQIWIQTLFDHNLSFVAPFELILFANRSSWPKLFDKAKFTWFWYCQKLFYVARVICLVLKFSESSSSFFLIFWVIAYVWLLLLAYDRLTGVWRVDLSRVLSVNHLHQHCRQVHTLIISLSYPVFMH